MKYPQVVERLLRLVNRLPGVGRKTAERYVFDFLLSWKMGDIQELSTVLLQMRESVGTCPICGCLSEAGKCYICSDTRREKEILCIVSSPKDVFTIENTQEFHGVYHVLQGLLSPLDGRGQEALRLDSLRKRVQENSVKEIIIAVDSTLEGDTTALVLKEELADLPVTVYRPAFGIPVGSSLEYVDGGSLARAIAGRSLF